MLVPFFTHAPMTSDRQCLPQGLRPTYCERCALGPLLVVKVKPPEHVVKEARSPLDHLAEVSREVDLEQHRLHIWRSCRGAHGRRRPLLLPATRLREEDIYSVDRAALTTAPGAAFIGPLGEQAEGVGEGGEQARTGE